MTPAELRPFFEGKWAGEGEIAGRGLLRWLMPREPFTISTECDAISPTLWRVRDLMAFSRGGEIRRTMFVERTGENRYHATADDMPLGADVETDERGYRYSPYWSWSGIRGRKWFVRVREDGDFRDDGSVAGRIRVSWHGIPIALNRLSLRRV